MLIEYARISTTVQNLNLQKDAQNKAGCDKIHEDYAGDAKTDRNGLETSIDSLRKGDTMVVWKLDRLGRSLKHLIEMINLINDQDSIIKFVQFAVKAQSNPCSTLHNQVCVNFRHGKTS